MAMGIKRQVDSMMKPFPLMLSGNINTMDLNLFPLGAYDVLIGMDWLAKHMTKFDF